MQSHFHGGRKKKKRSIFPLFMSALWWEHVKANRQRGCLMLNCRSDGVSHLFVKGSRMKEHLLRATVPAGTRKEYWAHDAQAAFMWDVCNAFPIWIHVADGCSCIFLLWKGCSSTGWRCLRMSVLTGSRLDLKLHIYVGLLPCQAG